MTKPGHLPLLAVLAASTLLAETRLGGRPARPARPLRTAPA